MARDTLSTAEYIFSIGKSTNMVRDIFSIGKSTNMVRDTLSTAEYIFSIAKAKMENLDSLLYQADIDGSTLLHMAVESGVTEIVALCLNHGARVREPKDKHSPSAFHLACAQGSVEMVKLMVEKDPVICRITLIDRDGMSPLHRAAANNQTNIVEFLLDQGAQVDLPDKTHCTPLFMAASNGATETVKLLMSRGANVTSKNVAMESVLHAAVGHMRTTEALLNGSGAAYLIPEKDRDGYAPIHRAARGGYLQNIHLFMTKNKAAAGITADSLDTPLHVACKFGWLEIVDDLLVGRNVRMINLKNNHGKTPLHFAAGEGHDKVVELLLDRGATIDRDHTERTPLHLAAITGSKRCVECILIKHPDCLNSVDEDQNIALNLASMHGHVDIVKHLLSIPQQDILMNNFNQNALDIAIKKEKTEVAMAMAENDRWRELMNTSSPGGLGQMKVLLIKMPEVAEKLLDRCVLKEGDPLKQNYKVTYDFAFLQGKITKTARKHDPLRVLRAMTSYRRDKCLMHHVPFKLMNLKWQTFGWLSLWLNLFIYLMYLMPLTVLAVHSKQNENTICNFNSSISKSEYSGKTVPCDSKDTVIQVMHFSVMLMTAFMCLREFMQMYNNRLQYFFYMPNYMEWTAYIFTFLFVFPPCHCKWGVQLQFGAVSLFFSWLNLILYFRKLSFYGQYVIMLASIFVTLAKVLMLFFLFVMAFGVTFYILLENVESFDRLETSLMTTFVMTLGEINYGDTFMPWNKLHYATFINILFIFFALGMPIILMNMLVGLAVGDIDSIQKNAVIDRYVMQIEMLLDTEDAIPRRIRRGFNFDKVVEYPNKPVSLRRKVYNAIFGFEHPNQDQEEEERLQEKENNERDNIATKLENQETRINQIYELLQIQSQMLHKLSGGDEEEEQETKKKRSFFLLS
ncbi:transient receptor potential cation channel subfamily A member 1 isoform X2 [Nematostella vectensis]|uniref:transient receptor potential cation channel subfamily A member 1 isoform X2 n=1 Tax=Nematostella vectensis TaxID=45351 RepID=UPI0020774219|nr:transient receptor potential cation channel subfamily A member 1 isoform X2 [Nematostella vectensis]